MAAAAAEGGIAPVPGNSTDSLPQWDDALKSVELLPKTLTADLKKEVMGKGVLIPLKTVAEVTQEHTITHVYITRAPTKCANGILR